MSHLVKALWDQLWFVNMGYTNKIWLIDWLIDWLYKSTPPPPLSPLVLFPYHWLEQQSSWLTDNWTFQRWRAQRAEEDPHPPPSPSDQSVSGVPLYTQSRSEGRAEGGSHWSPSVWWRLWLWSTHHHRLQGPTQTHSNETTAYYHRKHHNNQLCSLISLQMQKQVNESLYWMPESDEVDELTCHLHHSSVDTVLNIWRSHVKGSLGSNISCISVDVQPFLRIPDDLISATQRADDYFSKFTDSFMNRTRSLCVAAVSSYLSSELSGSKAMLLFRSVPGTTDSGTRICIGSSLNCGASFSFVTLTTTIAELTGRLGALLLRLLTFSTITLSTYSLCASKSRGCNTGEDTAF